MSKEKTSLLSYITTTSILTCHVNTTDTLSAPKVTSSVIMTVSYSRVAVSKGCSSV